MPKVEVAPLTAAVIAFVAFTVAVAVLWWSTRAVVSTVGGLLYGTAIWALNKR